MPTQAKNTPFTSWTQYILIAFVFVFFWFTTSQLRDEIQLLRSDIQPQKNTAEKKSVESYINKKSPPLLPAIPATKEEDAENESKRHGLYGGKGDPQHLGGFIKKDWEGISPALWDFMLGPLAIKSFLDLGCGRGFSTQYFLSKGAKVMCLEGSHDAVVNSVLPKEHIYEHDFTRGPWWPDETVDVVWSVEFLEHVGRQYMKNYIPILKKSALFFFTHSIWGGYHHVEVHPSWWWISRFTALGLVRLPELERIIRGTAKANETRVDNMTLGGRLSGLFVFINPEVASLPRHQHLFGGNGCYSEALNNADGGKPCEGVDALPSEYQSLLDCYRKNRGIEDVDALELQYLDCKPSKKSQH